MRRKGQEAPEVDPYDEALAQDWADIEALADRDGLPSPVANDDIPDGEPRPIGEALAAYLDRWTRPGELRGADSRLRSMPYGEYLRTPHWRRLRREKLARCGFHCEFCGADGPLEVHHRTYLRRGDEALSDLRALCARCHRWFHPERA